MNLPANVENVGGYVELLLDAEEQKMWRTTPKV